MHPINVRVGGFYNAPDPAAIAALGDPVREALDDAPRNRFLGQRVRFSRHRRLRTGSSLCETANSTRSTRAGWSPRTDSMSILPASPHWWTRSTSSARQRCTPASGTAVPISQGRWRATRSTPTPFRSSPRSQQEAPGSERLANNPFRSIVVRSVELVAACSEALRLISDSNRPDRRRPKSCPGRVREPAPPKLRGDCCSTHYEVDADGAIRSARIVPPTSQNQLTIEADLRQVAEASLELDDDELTWRCEQAVRNHDPCISCAAHFLEVARRSQSGRRRPDRLSPGS